MEVWSNPLRSLTWKHQQPHKHQRTKVNYISASHFLVEQLDRFELFKGRDLNAHMPTVEAYRRMLVVFEPIVQQVLNKDFNAGQIAKVLDAYKHPDAKP